MIVYYYCVTAKHIQRRHVRTTEIFVMTSTAMRIASLVTAINVLVAGGFSIAGLVSPKSVLPAGYAPTDASFIFAMYAAARSIPLAVTAMIAIYKHSESALLVLGILASFIQLLDAGVGLLQHDPGKSIGPLVVAAFQFFAVYLLSRSARGSPE
jgi:hypothetical protein